MKKLSLVLFLVFVITMVFSATSFATQSETGIAVTVNGEPINFPDAKPFTDSSGRVQVPVRYLAEALGVEVEWLGDTQTVIFNPFTPEQDEFNSSLSLVVGQDWYSTKGQYYRMDTSASNKGGRVYAPVRFISEAFGLNVDWDNSTRTVILNDSNESVAGPKPVDLGVDFIPGTGTDPMLIGKDFVDDSLANVLIPYAEELYNIFGDYLSDPGNSLDAFKTFIDTHSIEVPTWIEGFTTRDSTILSFEVLKRDWELIEYRAGYDDIALQLVDIKKPLSWSVRRGYGSSPESVVVNFYRSATVNMNSRMYDVIFQFEPSYEQDEHYLDLTRVTIQFSMERFNPIVDTKGGKLNAEVISGTGSEPMLIGKDFDKSAVCTVLNPYGKEIYTAFTEYLVDANDNTDAIDRFLDKHISQEYGDYEDNRSYSAWSFLMSKTGVFQHYDTSAIDIYAEALADIPELLPCNILESKSGNVNIRYPYEVVIDGKSYQFAAVLMFTPYEKDANYLRLQYVDAGTAANH